MQSVKSSSGTRHAPRLTANCGGMIQATAMEAPAAWPSPLAARGLVVVGGPRPEPSARQAPGDLGWLLGCLREQHLRYPILFEFLTCDAATER